MKITAIKTNPVSPGAPSLLTFIDQHISTIPAHSVLAVTSKIVSICEGRTVSRDSADKQALIREQADYYLPPESNRYNVTMTITNNFLVASAGVDESNTGGHYVLWPENPQATANALRRHLSTKHSHDIGVIITDTRTTPLRRGGIGIALAHSGFAALHSYVGQPDIFGQPLKYSVANIVDGLASASVAVMGEGAQQTPLAIIEDIGFVNFQDRDPTKKELRELSIRLEDDVYADAFLNLPWQKRPPHSQ